MLYRFARGIAAMLGLVPISEAAAYAEFDATLTALGVHGDEREKVLEMAAIIAQAGFTGDDLRAALTHISYMPYTGGHLPNE